MFGRQWNKCFLIAICLMVVAVSAAIAADDSNLAARAAAWEKEYNAGNLAGVAALYASDGCRMPPNAATVHGTEGIMTALKNGVAMGGAKIKIAVTGAETSGDMGHGWGTFELMKADGSPLDKGKWMNISKKAGGAWKIQCDIWNSDNPMPMPAGK